MTDEPPIRPRLGLLGRVAHGLGALIVFSATMFAVLGVEERTTLRVLAFLLGMAVFPYLLARAQGLSQTGALRRVALVQAALVASALWWSVDRRLPAEDLRTSAAIGIEALAGLILSSKMFFFLRRNRNLRQTLVEVRPSAVELFLAFVALVLASESQFHYWTDGDPGFGVLGLLVAPFVILSALEHVIKSAIGLRITTDGVVTLTELVQPHRVRDFKWTDNGVLVVQLKERPPLPTVFEDPIGFVTKSRRFWLGKRSNKPLIDRALNLMLGRPEPSIDTDFC